MRRIVIVIVVLLAVTFVLFSLTELENILQVLKQSNPIYLLAAFLFETLCLINISATFGVMYRLVGLVENGSRMFLITTAAIFLNLVAPSGGFGGLAIFLDEARLRNIPTGRVLVAGVLYLIYEYISVIIILILGFSVLYQHNSLNAGELVAGGFVLTLAVSTVTLFGLGCRSTEKLGNLLAALSRLVNFLARPILHREVLLVENAHKFSREMAEGITALRESRKNLVWPLLFTVNHKALLLCVLACTFLSLNVPFTLGTLVGGISISNLFLYASPTPSGVGFVEGILPSTLNNLMVPFTEAVLITLVYRALTVWIPFAIGFVTFRHLQSQARTPAPTY